LTARKRGMEKCQASGGIFEVDSLDGELAAARQAEVIWGPAGDWVCGLATKGRCWGWFKSCIAFW
jgi:hypothetical protein